jgi:hypothetical protein
VAATVLIALVGQLGVVAGTIGTHPNTSTVRYLPLTVVLVLVAVAVAISIGRIREPGHSRGDDGGRRRDRPTRPRPPVKPSSDLGLPGWLDALDGKLVDEPAAKIPSRV